MCINISAIEPLKETMKKKNIILKIFSIAVLGVLFPIYTSIVAFTYKVLLTVLCPAVLSKLAVILSFNACMAAYLGGIYAFLKLVCDISDYDYGFELLDNESDCEFITLWYCVVTDMLTLLIIAVSGFWAGKIIAGFFINTVKIFII